MIDMLRHTRRGVFAALTCRLQTQAAVQVVVFLAVFLVFPWPGGVETDIVVSRAGQFERLSRYCRQGGCVARNGTIFRRDAVEFIEHGPED